MFFVPKDESTLLYREHIQEQLTSKFATELTVPPPGATSRTNGKWIVSPPNFVRKTSRRIQWASRIEIEAEASKTVSQSPATEAPSLQVGPSVNLFSADPGFYGSLSDMLGSQPASAFAKIPVGAEWGKHLVAYATGRNVITTHKGVDAFEVLWSADVTTSRELRRPSIDEIKHMEPTWEQVT